MTNQTKDKMHADSAGVKIPPPLIVAVLLLVGVSIDSYIGKSFGLSQKGIVVSGIGLLLAGIGLMLWSAMTFRRFKTNILPHTPDSAMMDSGPFAHSRNPIYVAFLLLYLGVCLLMDAPVALVFIVPAVLALRYYVIAREEAYLIRRFGATYTEYQSRVRRWL